MPLTADNLDHCFIAFDSLDNCRQRAQYQIDQLSIGGVADSDLKDRWAVVPRSPTKGKVSVLGDEDRGAGNGFVPDPLVGSRQQPEVDKVDRLTTVLPQCLSQRRRKLRVDQKEQNLFRRNDGVVCLTGSKGQNRIDVRVFKIGIFLKDRLSRLASRHQAQNVRHRNTQATNTWTAMHAIAVDRYSFQEI
jgi:hypothetical protein